MSMMSCYDLIKGEGHVQNCTASYWSVYISQVGHMIIVCFDWLWWLEGSDKTPDTDSWDPYDHGVRPEDPSMGTYSQKNIIKGCVYTSCTIEFWPTSVVSNDSGAHWPEQLLFC